MTKPQMLYEWIIANNATQEEAALFFNINQSYVSRAIRKYAVDNNLPAIDRRRKVA